jgi:uncharacterized protein with NAD-binding domain and iron-sulfur cluster
MEGAAMSAPKKVAVLGGGVAAMTAAFELTRPEMAGQYEVTVYQMGWRLGGKGASGRNRAIADRIEEHGLHIWMGFYDNAFTVMQEAYAELNRSVGPLQTWEEAFKKHSYIVLEEPLDGQQYRWQLDFPTNDCVPGRDASASTIWEMSGWAFQWIYNHWFHSPEAKSAPGTLGAPPIPDWIEDLVHDAEARGPVGAPPSFGCIGTVAGEPPPPRSAADAQDAASARFARAYVLAVGVPRDGQAPAENVKDAIIQMIRDGMACVRMILGDSIETNFHLFQLWVGINLAGSAAIGILADDILIKGWDSIDDRELRAWVASHGADPSTTLASGPIRGIYDLAFAYQDGDIAQPQFAAGTAMRGMLRMALTYKGAIFYKMQAGMGDTVFTPLYLVLKQRGVKFEFFHRVTDVRVSEEAKVVTAIEMSEQVQLTGGGYEPLIDVKGLACWPSEPIYGQIQFGQELRASGINLESTWSPEWKYAQAKTIYLGEDFDLVVYGISLGALQQSAPSLLAASPPLAATFTNVKTVQTCAFQLWLKPDLAGLGWQDPPGITERPVLGAFVEPLDTWADMSQLLVRETWPDDAKPQNVAYFCGVLQELAPPPPPSDHAFPARQLDRLDTMAIAFLNDDIKLLWPEAASGAGFKWDLLVDLKPEIGEARFQSQYRRVNIDPTERYVLSVPKSTAYRLPPDGTGYSNLFITGDWIRCGLNAGCVEAAVTAGMLASRAITGGGPPIHGACDGTVLPRG